MIGRTWRRFTLSGLQTCASRTCTTSWVRLWCSTPCSACAAASCSWCMQFAPSPGLQRAVNAFCPAAPGTGLGLHASTRKIAWFVRLGSGWTAGYVCAPNSVDVVASYMRGFAHTAQDVGAVPHGSSGDQQQQDSGEAVSGDRDGHRRGGLAPKIVALAGAVFAGVITGRLLRRP